MNNQNTIEQRSIINEPMYDSETKEFGKGYSPDGGKTFIVQESNDGRRYHQDTDAPRISELIFDKLLIRSKNGTLFALTVSDDGTLIINKREL